MARPHKIGLDYFPLDVNIDDNLELIEAEHGLSGFAIVIKLWQKIYSNGYYLEWSEDSSLLFSRKINSELILVNSVINSCFRRNIFDENLYKKHEILTSSGIQKRYLTACYQSKRKSIPFIKPYLLVNSEFTAVITELIELNNEENTQSKVKESKEDKSKKKTNNNILLSQVDESTLDHTEKKYYQIAISFFELVKSSLKELNISGSEIENAKFKTWVDPIRLLIENDKRTIDEFREIFSFLQKDEFWKEQIRSTAKLRKKNKDERTYFEVLLEKSRNGQKRKQQFTNNGKQSNSGVSPEYKADILKRLLAD